MQLPREARQVPERKTCRYCKTEFARPKGMVDSRWNPKVYCSVACSARGTKPPKQRTDPLNRLMSKVLVHDDGCWEWTGSRDNRGYGQSYYDNRLCLAHRMAYQLLVGPIPEGLELDHLCLNHSCVNPEHLQPVTHAENMRRYGQNKTHCPQGHSRDEPGSLIFNGTGMVCRRCKQDRDKAYYHRKKAERDATNA